MANRVKFSGEKNLTLIGYAKPEAGDAAAGTVGMNHEVVTNPSNKEPYPDLRPQPKLEPDLTLTQNKDLAIQWGMYDLLVVVHGNRRLEALRSAA